MEFFENFLPKFIFKYTLGSIQTDFKTPSEHSIPTTDYGNSCDYLGTPYINKCNYDGAGAAFQALYTNVNQSTTANGQVSNLLRNFTEFSV